MKLKIRIDTPEVTSAAPSQRQTFLMTGGGTGGHVIPLIAVARELRKRGHDVFFIGTEAGLESRLVPPEEMPIAFIKIGGLQRVGWRQTLRTLMQLPVAVWKSMELIRQHKPNAVFCLGGFVAGPPVIAAWLLRKPVVLMEPNAIPGMVNRSLARIAKRALLSFPEAQRFFPKGRAEITGLPVRAEFFRLPRRKPGEVLTVLVTGGSRGSRRLNEAGRGCWKLFQESQVRVRWIHQTGTADYTEMASAFAESGAEGQVVPFIENMPQVFGTADLVVCRSGAGAVSELAAAGKPAILVPFPFAADQHQLKNAEAMSRAGAARLILDATLTGEELFHTIRDLAADPVQLERMGEAARQFAKPGAAMRAVEVLEREGMRRKRA